MTELEIEELKRHVTGSDSVIVEEARSVEAFPDHEGEDVRNVLPEQAHSQDEDEVAIVMEIAEVIERVNDLRLETKCSQFESGC